MQRRCGWCETLNIGEHTNCVNCGGPLPLPPGSDPGPAPEATPRHLPGTYTRGLFINYLGVQSALQARRVLRMGRATRGRVSDVQLSAGFWTLTYLYDVGEGTLGGSLQTKDAIVSQYSEGDVLHVVTTPTNPRKARSGRR